MGINLLVYIQALYIDCLFDLELTY